MASKKAPDGTWVSPISAETIAKGANTISDVIVDPVTSIVYHIEDRASEAGRAVLVQTQTKTDIVGKNWDVRTAVHEFGGAAAIVYNDIAYFSHAVDGRVYEVDINNDGEPAPVTPDKPYRYANFDVLPTHPRLLVSILEDHTVDIPSEIINRLCVIDSKNCSVYTLTSGADFYAKPTFSPDGTKIAWQQWNHPDMPWHGSEIFVATVSVKSVIGSPIITIKNDTLVAGVPSKTSAAYPSWIDSNTLIFTSDESGYINPWIYDVAKNQPTALFSNPKPYEFGRPGWYLNWFPYALLGGTHAAFNVLQDGRDVLCLISLSDSSEVQFIDSPYVFVEAIRAVGNGFDVVFMGKTMDEETRIVRCSLNRLGSPVAKFHLVNDNMTKHAFPKSFISFPKTITIHAPTSSESLTPLYLIYYPPCNPSYAGTSLDGEKPPCVVNVHPGPTMFDGQGLNWEIQYYTSRGWAWLNVNYGGSSGYGRAFIDRLSGLWGVVDGQDIVYAARTISSEQYNLADAKRMVIRGASAGGFTTLSVLTSQHDVFFETPFSFAAATSVYGISDFQKLAKSTHKFQSHYLDKLLGGTHEEVPEVYKARSPVHKADKVTIPLLLLQGDEDKNVAKEQSELIFTSIKKRGGVVEYKEYQGEAHGWRKEETIRDALERERAFYERVLNLQVMSSKL